ILTTANRSGELCGRNSRHSRPFLSRLVGQTARSRVRSLNCLVWVGAVRGVGALDGEEVEEGVGSGTRKGADLEEPPQAQLASCARPEPGPCDRGCRSTLC